MKELKWIVTLIVLVVILGCISPELRTTRIAINEEDWNRALKSAESELIRNPSSAEAFYWKGYVYEKLGDYPNMSEAFEKCLEISPQFAEKIKNLRLRLITRYDKRYVEAYNNEEWDVSLAALDTAIIIDPGFLELYKRAVMTAYYGGHYDRAIQYALTTIEREEGGEKNISVRRIMMIIYQEQENHEQTIHWAKELITLVDPSDDEDEVYITSIGAMVGAYEALGDHKASEEVIEKAIQTFPEDVDLKMNLAYFMIDREDFQGASEIYQAVIVLDPDNLLANLNLGKIMFNQKKFSETIRYLEKVLEVDENNTEAMSVLASAYFNSDMDSKGQEMLKRLKATVKSKDE